MHLVTKCPSCYTHFIVRPDQLEAHQGKVRCGQCQHVFIAQDHLSEQAATDNLSGNNTKSKKSLALYASLVVVALLQVIFFLRADIARTWPALKPALTNTCQVLGCVLPLPHKTELMAIDDTELVKDEAHQGVVKFSCLIINNAQQAQSYPSIELTLTDRQDVPILRRKITPKEYLSGSSIKLGEGLAGNDEVRVTLNINAANYPVSGFRALLVD